MLRLRFGEEQSHAVQNGKGLTIHVRERPLNTAKLPEIPAGSHAVSVFPENQREPTAELRLSDTAYAFQAELEIRSERLGPRACVHRLRTFNEGPSLFHCVQALGLKCHVILQVWRIQRLFMLT